MIEDNVDNPEATLQSLLRDAMRVCVESLGTLVTEMYSGNYRVLQSLTLHRVTPSADLLLALSRVSTLRELRIAAGNNVSRAEFSSIPYYDEIRDMETGCALQHLLQTVRIETLELWGMCMWRPLPWIARALPRMHSLQRLIYMHYSQPLTQYTTSDERALLSDHLSNLLLATSECPTLTVLHINHLYSAPSIISDMWHVDPPRLKMAQLTPPRSYMAPHPALRELWLPDLPLLAAPQGSASELLPAIENFRIMSEDSRLWGHREDVHGIVEFSTLDNGFAALLQQMPRLHTLTLPRIIMRSHTNHPDFATTLTQLQNLRELNMSVCDQGSLHEPLRRLEWIIDIAAACPQIRSIVIDYICGMGFCGMAFFGMSMESYELFMTRVRSVAQVNPECNIVITGVLHEMIDKLHRHPPYPAPIPRNVKFVPVTSAARTQH
jgi:hypothetical protein